MANVIFPPKKLTPQIFLRAFSGAGARFLTSLFKNVIFLSMTWGLT
jgi:hypothetical protein